VNMENTLPSPAAQAGNRVPLDMRIAILFYRFGPYHHGRLNAAGRLMSVWGVEACATEDVYAWDKVDGAGAFTRVTLTDRDSDDPRWRRELQQRMRRALDEIKPQVVVIPGWISADALGALGWCAETGTPAVVMSESNSWDEPRSFWKEWIKGRLVKMCAAGLAGGTAHRDYLSQLGMPRDRIFLGYDAVDNDYFATRTAEIRNRKSEIQVQLGLPEKYFLASARFVGKKNLPRLLEAYARYRTLAEKSELGHPGSEIWKLVLLGDGPLKSTLNSQLASLNLHAHVLLPGFKQYGELPACYGLASAFIHASTTEQWGLVVNEAMASGLPVLVSNRCGCAADLVQPGVNGFTFDPGNVEEMARQMFQLSTLSPSQLSTMGAASRLIIADWGPERFAVGLRDAIAVALKTPPPRVKPLDRLLLRLLLQR
jgi:1,2-diacylglycerol 3-alpha-glucosyltransferase